MFAMLIAARSLTASSLSSACKQFVEKQQIKFEGCKQALHYAHKGNKMIKYYLKSGYFHIEIHEDFQKYLGFS